MLLGGIRYLLPIIKKAHERGHYVITADYLPDNVAHKYSDEYVNVSIIDKEAVLEVARKKQIDGIMSFGVDPGVVTAAYVAEMMHLPFQCSYNAACILQNKSLFREFLTNNGFNCPKAKCYDSIESALLDSGRFVFPIIVKPVDSAGSKGVMRVDNRDDLQYAATNAMSSSLSGKIIIEEFLDVVGFQSSADVFAIDGRLVHPAFSDQLFDQSALNPYTPAIEIWPSSMPQAFQTDLSIQLQRLFDLLGIRSGIFNVESRVCSNGKAYLMEVSPRGGGNRIAELQRLACGQDLIAQEVNQALGLAVEDLSRPVYNGVWCNYILHSCDSGLLKSIKIDAAFKNKYVIDEGYSKSVGERIEPFSGANTSLGSLFIRTETRDEMDNILAGINGFIHIELE